MLGVTVSAKTQRKRPDSWTPRIWCCRTRIKMNAFKAFKACAPIEWSSNLYITLVRGIPGTRRLHRRTLEALRLCKCNRTVMRWNTPTVRGMLQQVKRLVVIETEEMYKARKQKEANHLALRPPLVVNHLPGLASGSALDTPWFFTDLPL